MSIYQRYYPKAYPVPASGQYLRSIPINPEDLKLKTVRLTDDQVEAAGDYIIKAGFDTTDNFGIDPNEDHAAQKWIAEAKEEIITKLLEKRNDNTAEGIRKSLYIDEMGKYKIRQAGNLTRVAAYLYSKSDMKKEVHKISEQNKKAKKEFLAEHEDARLNARALHIAERPLRNDIYEMEQIDKAEFPNLNQYFHPHKLNYKIPTIETMNKLREANVVPVFPPDYRRIPDWYREFQARGINPPNPDLFKFSVASGRKAKLTLPKHLSKALSVIMPQNNYRKFLKDFRKADDVGKKELIRQAEELTGMSTQYKAPEKTKAPQKLQEYF